MSGRDRTDSIRDARSRRENSDTDVAGELAVCFGGEGRGLFVTYVDQSDIAFHASVVDREDVPARQRVDHVDTVALERFGDEMSPVGFHPAMLQTALDQMPSRCVIGAGGPGFGLHGNHDVGRVLGVVEHRVVARQPDRVLVRPGCRCWCFARGAGTHSR